MAETMKRGATLYVRALNGRFYRALYRHRTIRVMEEDWDNLILLDACRHDMFARHNTIPGELRAVYSRGSNTNQFLKENFQGRYFGDTVYVTANPLVDYHVPDAFYKIVPVWRRGWHEPFGTVLPGTVFEYAREAQARYKDKRLIVHFMQPHFPFIGEKSRAMIGEHEGILSRNYFYGGETEHTQDVWKLFRAGRLTRDQVWRAYEENLDIVLDKARALVETLRGKTVISSDHGNLFGQWSFPLPLRIYGHPANFYHPDLIRVPWLVVAARARRRIRAEERPETVGRRDGEEYADKLRSLGYV